MSTTLERLKQWAADLQAGIDAAKRGGIEDYAGREVQQLADLEPFIAIMEAKVPPLRVYLDAYKTLRFIDRADLYDVGLKLGDLAWGRFVQHPSKWLIEATDADAAKVWQAVERKQRT